MSATVSPNQLRQENSRYYTFLNLSFFLAVITGIEILIIILPFPKSLIAGALIVLSSIKFFGVIFWFMHLIYDKRLLTFLFLFGLVLALGTVAALILLMSPQDLAPPVEL